MDTVKNIDKFIDFLVAHDALRYYLDALGVECTQDAIYYLIGEKKTPESFIWDAFYWSDTEQGLDYWGNLSEQWQELVEKDYRQDYEQAPS